MIRIRSINTDELDYFVSLADPPADEHGAIDKRILTELWTSGKSGPEWCFVAEENGKLVGRVAYTEYEYPATVEPFQIKLPWTGNYLEVGEKLIRESIRGIVAGDRTNHNSPAQPGKQSKLAITHLTRDFGSFLKQVDEQRAALKAVGIPLIQEMTGFDWTGPQLPVESPERLHFRSLGHVSDQTFIEAIQQVMLGTLDRFLQVFINSVNESFFQEDFYALQENFDFETEWWQLAYTKQGELVGLIQPVLFRSGTSEEAREGLIAFIGVVPEQRGNGYVNDLLARATAILQSVGVGKIYAQTDVINFPMLHAFEQLGYARTSTIWKYHAELEQVMASWEDR